MALAEGLSHPYSLAYTLWHAALSHLLRREEQGARERAEAVITLSTEQGFMLLLALGTILRGALAAQGQEEAGIQEVQQSMAALQATGAESYRPYHLALLADAYGKGERVEEGLAVLAEALDGAHKTGERWYEAELYRLKGALTLQSQVQGSKSHVEKEVEECFHKAIEIAQKQQAKSLELRAAMSLARLWQQQGKQKEAHHMLVEIYDWFTEGFDIKDLQEAKALLDELAEAC